MSDFVFHQIEPEFDSSSRVLILGTIPSPKSREYGFYYMHPQNRFWKLLYDIFEEPFQDSVADRKDLIHKKHIALWDVLASCDIVGASDSSIRNPKANDLSIILRVSAITHIFVTGKTAEKYYNQLCKPNIKIDCICLPSPSPANCAIKYDKMLCEYKKIRNCIEEEITSEV